MLTDFRCASDRWAPCNGSTLRRALPLVAALLMLSSIGLPGGPWPWSLRAQRSGSGGGGGGGRGMAQFVGSWRSAGAGQDAVDGEDEDTDEPSLVVRQVSSMATIPCDVECHVMTRDCPPNE